MANKKVKVSIETDIKSQITKDQSTSENLNVPEKQAPSTQGLDSTRPDTKPSSQITEPQKSLATPTEAQGQKPDTNLRDPKAPPNQNPVSPSLDPEEDLSKKPNPPGGAVANPQNPKSGDSIKGQKDNPKVGKIKQPLNKRAAQAGSKAAKAVANFAKQAASKAIASVTAAAAPYLIPIIVVLLCIILIFGLLFIISTSGLPGKTFPQRAGKNNADVLALVAASTKEVKSNSTFNGASNKGKTYHKLDFTNQKDLDYIKSGKIDRRLAASLNYLVQKHEHINVSHIVSAYEDMKTDPESGAFHDTQITKNISAHQEGLAVDIDEVDFVKEQCDCGRDIPVKIAWQSMNENPFGEAPDALNQIKSADSFANSTVTKALEKIGVKGLDQADLVNKMKAIPVLAGISGPYDLTDSKVINAFNTIGVTGLDNEDLQKGLKRVQALQNLYDLAPSDISALNDPKVQQLMQSAGVPVSQELLSNVSKYQAVQLLRTITSPEDFNREDMQKALQTLDVNTADPNYQSMMSKVSAASTLSNWQGDYTDQKIKDALGQFNITMSADAEQSLKIYQTASKLFTATNNGMVNDAEIIRNLDRLAIDIGNPTAQDAVNKMKAAYKIYKLDGNYADPELAVSLQQMGITLGNDAKDALTKYQAAYKAVNYQGDYNNPEFMSYIQTLGIPVNDDTKQALSVYQSASQVMKFQGDFTSPEFVAAVSKIGLDLGANSEIISKYKAATTLASAAEGNISLNSQEVKNALKTIGASSINDAKAKSAINIGKSQDANDPSLQKDKEILGMNKAEWQATITKLQAAKNLMNVNDFSDLQDPKVQNSLQTLGLKDPKYYDAINKIGGAYSLLKVKDISDLQNPNVQKALQNIGLKDPKYYDAIGKLSAAEKLLHIKDISDLQNPEVQKSLQQIGIKDPKVYEALGKIGGLQTLLQVKSVQDLSNPKVADALKSLGVKNQAVFDNLAKVGSAYALTQIKSPWDLTKPEVIKALGDLKIADTALQGQLTKAGSVYALTQIKSPTDLLKPESLKALDTLGVIKMNDQLLGQIGAVQTLMQVNSVTDLLNPSSILALNTLGIISLSNPVTTALMAVVFIDNLLGGKLLGGIFGGNCKASTKCYKPTAQANNHKLIEELLQFPIDKNDKNLKITQIITYSQERDVTPFADKLNQLYGSSRPANYGLFAMPEAWDHLHIAY